MARVPCEVSSAQVETEFGAVVPGVCVTCGRCQHEVEVPGESGRSVRRGLATLRDECPRDERNFYYDVDEDAETDEDD